MSASGIDRAFERRLASLVNTRERGVLQGGLKGVEKESLRVQPDGRLARTPHPAVLGSALTHEFITMDYSEALIELVTPAFGESWELLQFLCDLHQFVYRHLGDEWTLILAGEAEEEGTGARWMPGDLVHRSPGTAHAYRAVSREPLVFAVVLHGGIELEGDAGVAGR